MAGRPDQDRSEHRQEADIGADIDDDIAFAQHLEEEVRDIRLEKPAGLQPAQDAFFVRAVLVQIELDLQLRTAAAVEAASHDRYVISCGCSRIVCCSKPSLQAGCAVSLERSRSARVWELNKYAIRRRAAEVSCYSVDRGGAERGEAPGRRPLARSSPPWDLRRRFWVGIPRLWYKSRRRRSQQKADEPRVSPVGDLPGP
jgi:hypothetical protein